MTMAIVICVPLALGAFWYFRHSAKGKLSTEKATPVKRTQPYAGVEIHCGQNACTEAKGLRNKKLLASSAPALPLTGCSADNCACAYRKWDDRRQESRRSMDDGLEPLIFDGKEYRDNDERRDPDDDQLASGF